MALDSELNVSNKAEDIAYDFRKMLLSQTINDEGPAQFGDMRQTYEKWHIIANSNLLAKGRLHKLTGQLLRFSVDRRPASPVM